MRRTSGRSPRSSSSERGRRHQAGGESSSSDSGGADEMVDGGSSQQQRSKLANQRSGSGAVGGSSQGRPPKTRPIDIPREQAKSTTSWSNLVRKSLPHRHSPSSAESGFAPSSPERQTSDDSGTEDFSVGSHPNQRTMVVRDLETATDSPKLRALFEQNQIPPQAVSVMRNEITHEPIGAGFVIFDSSEEYRAAKAVVGRKLVTSGHKIVTGHKFDPQQFKNPFAAPEKKFDPGQCRSCFRMPPLGLDVSSINFCYNCGAILRAAVTDHAQQALNREIGKSGNRKRSGGAGGTPLPKGARAVRGHSNSNKQEKKLKKSPGAGSGAQRRVPSARAQLRASTCQLLTARDVCDNIKATWPFDEVAGQHSALQRIVAIMGYTGPDLVLLVSQLVHAKRANAGSIASQPSSAKWASDPLRAHFKSIADQLQWSGAEKKQLCASLPYLEGFVAYADYAVPLPQVPQHKREDARRRARLSNGSGGGVASIPGAEPLTPKKPVASPQRRPRTFVPGREYQFEEPSRTLAKDPLEPEANRLLQVHYALRIQAPPVTMAGSSSKLMSIRDSAFSKTSEYEASQVRRREYIGYALCDITSTTTRTFPAEPDRLPISKTSVKHRVPIVLKLFRFCEDGQREMEFQRRAGDSVAPRVFAGVKIGLASVAAAAPDLSSKNVRVASISPHPKANGHPAVQPAGTVLKSLDFVAAQDKPARLGLGAVLESKEATSSLHQMGVFAGTGAHRYGVKRHPATRGRASRGRGRGRSSVRPARQHISQLGMPASRVKNVQKLTADWGSTRDIDADQAGYNFALLMESAGTTDTVEDFIRQRRQISLHRYFQFSRENPSSDLAIEGGLNLHDWIDVARRMCKCVQALHRQEIVHLDLKPSQFMQFSRTLKLVDYGSCVDLRAHRRRHGGSVRMKAANLAVTDEYCPPEIYRAASSDDTVQLTTHADMWSFGITLLQMAAGCLPWYPCPIQAQGQASANSDSTSSPPRTPRSSNSYPLGGYSGGGGADAVKHQHPAEADLPKRSAPSSFFPRVPSTNSIGGDPMSPRGLPVGPGMQVPIAVQFQRLWDRLPAMRFASVDDERMVEEWDARGGAAGGDVAAGGPLASSKATCPMPTIDTQVKRRLLRLLRVDPGQRESVDALLGCRLFGTPEDTRQRQEKDLIAFFSSGDMAPKRHQQVLNRLEATGVTGLRLNDVARLVKHAEGVQFTNEMRSFSAPDKLRQEMLMPETLDDCRKHIWTHNPRIIHFSGYGSSQGRLYFPKHWSHGTEFAEVCQLSDSLHTVFINACYGERMLADLVSTGTFGICWTSAVMNEVAELFSLHFYFAYADWLGSDAQNLAGGAPRLPRGVDTMLESAGMSLQHLRVFNAFQYARSKLTDWLRLNNRSCGDPEKSNNGMGVLRLLVRDSQSLLAAAAAATGDNAQLGSVPEDAGTADVVSAALSTVTKAPATAAASATAAAAAAAVKNLWAIADDMHDSMELTSSNSGPNVSSGGDGGRANDDDNSEIPTLARRVRKQSAVIREDKLCQNYLCPCRLWCCHAHFDADRRRQISASPEKW